MFVAVCFCCFCPCCCSCCWLWWLCVCHLVESSLHCSSWGQALPFLLEVPYCCRILPPFSLRVDVIGLLHCCTWSDVTCLLYGLPCCIVGLAWRQVLSLHAVVVLLGDAPLAVLRYHVKFNVGPSVESNCVGRALFSPYVGIQLKGPSWAKQHHFVILCKVQMLNSNTSNQPTTQPSKQPTKQAQKHSKHNTTNSKQLLITRGTCQTFYQKRDANKTCFETTKYNKYWIVKRKFVPSGLYPLYVSIFY